MKIFKFRNPYGKRYAYIRANWFERRAIRKRIAEGDPWVYPAPAFAPGPKVYGAQFIIGALRKRT